MKSYDSPACKHNTANHNKFMCVFHRANIYIIQDVPCNIVCMESYDLQPEVNLIQGIGLTLSLGIKQTNTTVRLKSQDTIYFHAIHAISIAQCKPHTRLHICTVLNYRFSNTIIDLRKPWNNACYCFHQIIISDFLSHTPVFSNHI